MASIIEIADLAGVSPATVSRALSNSAKVSVKAQTRIEKAMKKVGYSLEVYKKRKNSPITKMKNIAFLVLSRDVLQEFSTSFYKLTRAVSLATVQMHANMIHAYTDSLDNLPPAVANGTIDGLILAGSCDDDGILEMISKIPTVWLSSHQERGIVLPLGGNESVGHIAAEYLKNRGHKKVAFLNAFSEHLAMKTRSDFFEFYSNKNGIETDMFTMRGKGKIFTSLNEIKIALEDLLDQWLNSKDRATGLFVPLDLQVAICYRILASKGIEIGKDVEFIGCDNDEAALIAVDPRPATIDIGAEAMGYKAVQELLWKIDNPNAKNYEGVKVVVEPKLVPGSTSSVFGNND